MKSNFLILCAAVGGLAACNGGGVVDAGYATSTSDLDAKNTRFTSRQVMHFDDDDFYGLREVTVKVRNTADPTVKYVTIEGTTVKVTESGLGFYEGLMEGPSGDLYVSIYVGEISDNEQVALAWLIWDDDRLAPPEWEHLWGAFVGGYSTDPLTIDARTLTATYAGGAIIGLQRDDLDWTWASASGTATLYADFDLDEIDGSIEFTNVEFDELGYEITVPTTATIETGTIVGNTFTSTVTLDDPGAFSIDSAAPLDLEGMFYEYEGTGVGGTFAGTGLDDGGATNVFIQGGFIGSEQP